MPCSRWVATERGCFPRKAKAGLGMAVSDLPPPAPLRPPAKREDATHYPGHLRDAFGIWVESGMPPEAEVDAFYPRTWEAERLLRRMWHCSDTMPPDLCSTLDVPQGSSYAQAAQGLLAERKSQATYRRAGPL